jgi:poly-gamma-glutamate capsule biosynthesis protein CapA/YwtB (metallophosphatase superfamily)
MNDVLLGLVGDVLVDRENPIEAFRDVAEVLGTADILFGHLDAAYSDDPHPAPGAALVVGAPTRNLDALARVGFDVLSLAGNHILDMGYPAMLETRARLNAQGIQTCGAGPSEAEARAPAVVEVNGLRVAFLAYGSVFPMGYEAHGARAGLAPVRAYNFWREPVPNYFQPGCTPVLVTVPDSADLAELANDIARAREVADLVVTSFHWGDFSRPFRLTEHEKSTARFCIEQGADLVVGHHHHSLRGIEWYRGKPILYGLGHLIADLRFEMSEEIHEALLADGGEDLSFRVGPRQGWPLLPLHKDSRMTVVAWACVGKEGVSSIAVLPCHLTPDGIVHPLQLDSREGQRVMSYLEKCNRTQGLKTSIVLDRPMSIGEFAAVRLCPDAHAPSK